MAGTKSGSSKDTLCRSLQESLELMKAQIDRLAFGSIAVTIHEGRVVQLEVTEKRRLS